MIGRRRALSIGSEAPASAKAGLQGRFQAGSGANQKASMEGKANMKSWGMFLATSCLGVALATGAAAQETQQPPPQTQDEQQQQQQQPQQQPEPQQPEAQQQPDQYQLPRTASPMPLAALAGMASLAAAGIVRKLRK